MSAPYPPTLSPLQLATLRDLAIDWSLAHGLVVRPTQDKQAHFANNAAVTHAPFSLFPSQYPRPAFDQAVRLQRTWNDLIHKISEDEAFLTEVMADLSQVDDFVSHLYDVYLAVRREGIAQPVSLGLHRCDYLLHVPLGTDLATTTPVIQQVEFNTISSSFGSLSTLTGQMHRSLLAATDYYVEPGKLTAEQLPENESIKSIAKGIAKAWEVYGKKSAIVLMVVQSGERNAFDQRWIEYNLLENHHVRLIRRTLAEIAEQASLDPETKALILDGHEIAVTYFRSGYGPDDYPSDKEWVARLLLERSLSIKSPTVAYQLVGAKKVQQVLASPGVLERFLPVAQANDLRVVFAGLYPLDASPAGHAALEVALREPHRFVLKPQREGGGNNVYGEDIREVLEGLGERERNKFILMDLIRSPPFRGYMVREGQLIDAQVVSELGIFGIFLGSGPTVILNETGGHLLRTKSHESNEGGVAAGFAVIDSPLLV